MDDDTVVAKIAYGPEKMRMNGGWEERYRNAVVVRVRDLDQPTRDLIKNGETFGTLGEAIVKLCAEHTHKQGYPAGTWSEASVLSWVQSLIEKGEQQR